MNVNDIRITLEMIMESTSRMKLLGQTNCEINRIRIESRSLLDSFSPSDMVVGRFRRFFLDLGM